MSMNSRPLDVSSRARPWRREQAIRAALGGSKLRLLLICVAGGALGFLLAVGVLYWFVAVRHDVPRADSIAVDGVVTAFTLGLVILCAAFAGAVSAFSIRREQALLTLRESPRSQSAGVARTRLRSVLLSLEVGLTVVLLIDAGLLLKSYAQLRSTDLGCLTGNVLKMDLSLPTASIGALIGRARAGPRQRSRSPPRQETGSAFVVCNTVCLLERDPRILRISSAND